MSPSLRFAAFLGLLVVGVSPLGAEATSVTYSPPKVATVLGSTFVEWSSLRFVPTPVGRYCPVFDQPTASLAKLEVHVTTLLPGMASHPPHHHPWEEMLLVKEGQIEVSINGVKKNAGPGSLVFLASQDAHNATNSGTVPATYYVINFCPQAFASVSDTPAAELAKPGMLSSCVVDCDSIPDPPAGGHRKIVDSPTLTFLKLESHISTLKPGASTSPDGRDPGDELFIVKSGVLEAKLNGVSCRLGPGSFYYVAPNDRRTMANPGTQSCFYQVIKVVTERSPAAPGI